MKSTIDIEKTANDRSMKGKFVSTKQVGTRDICKKLNIDYVEVK